MRRSRLIFAWARTMSGVITSGLSVDTPLGTVAERTRLSQLFERDWGCSSGHADGERLGGYIGVDLDLRQSQRQVERRVPVPLWASETHVARLRPCARAELRVQ